MFLRITFLWLSLVLKCNVILLFYPLWQIKTRRFKYPQMKIEEGQKAQAFRQARKEDMSSLILSVPLSNSSTGAAEVSSKVSRKLRGSEKFDSATIFCKPNRA
jgi:hypothetical protein